MKGIAFRVLAGGVTLLILSLTVLVTVAPQNAAAAIHTAGIKVGVDVCSCPVLVGDCSCIINQTQPRQ